jgi:adenylosuccinate synthase
MQVIGERLQSIGAEVGVTTGRKRRCGWLDVVVLKYSQMINGYSCLNVTKLDVLDTFDEIQIAIAYTSLYLMVDDNRYRLNGKELASFPADLTDLEKVEVVYETMPGWKKDITKCRRWDELPVEAQKYIYRIQELVGVKGALWL